MQSITGMTASDWAAWVGAIGTVAAAWLAVWLYFRSRSDVKRDERAKRKVLHAVLREYVKNAAALIADKAPNITSKTFDDLDVRLRLAVLELEDMDRLIDLQSRLMDFGEEGDADIAAFIEACRQYHKTYSAVLGFEDRTRATAHSDKAELADIAIAAIRVALDRVSATVQPALAAVKRFDEL